MQVQGGEQLETMMMMVVMVMAMMERRARQDVDALGYLSIYEASRP